MQEPQKVPERPKDKGPAMWLITRDANAKRLRLIDGRLRTVIGYETIFTKRVEEINLEQVQKFEIMAPYTMHNPRLSLIIFGLSVGMILGSQFEAAAAIVLAIMTITFSVVALVVGRTKNQNQRLARIEMTNNQSYTVAYLVEDESDIKRLFGDDKWEDSNLSQGENPLLPEEEKLAERMRYGALLTIGSACVIVLLMAISDGTGISQNVTVPVNILYLSVLGFAMLFSAVSWYKMSKVGR